MSSDSRLDEDLIRRLPLPLAQLYRRANNAKTAIEQHLTAFYLWEVSIKLLAATAVAEYVARGERDPTLDEGIRNLANPGLGQWWECIRILVPKLGRNDAAFHEVQEQVFGAPRDDLPQTILLSQLLREEVILTRGLRSTVRLAELIEQLIGYRGREIGHQVGAERATTYHERMAPALLGAFTEVFTTISPLAKRDLYLLSGHEPEARGQRLFGFWLTGEQPVQSAPSLIQDTRKEEVLAPGLVYLVGGSTLPIVAVSPLLGYETDEAEVYFLNTVRDETRVQYLGYTSGRVTVRALKGNAQTFLHRIFSLPTGKVDLPIPDTALPGEPAPSLVDENEILPRIGEFTIQGLIGSGGMTRVYRAWQPSLGRQVALKVMDVDTRPEAGGLFREEIKALATVDHPNLVKVYATGEGDGLLYSVMELLQGEPIHKVAEEWRKLVERQELRKREYVNRVVWLMAQVVDALAALHNAGFLHGDVKPTNVMISPDERRAVLFDPLIVPTFVPGQVYGTPGYVSPERCLAAAPSDHRSDLYGVGVVLWELLAGQRRFRDANLGAILAETPQRPPDPLRPHNAAVSADLESIVHKCLEIDPDRRYATASDLAADLGRFLAGDPIQAGPVALHRRLSHFVYRHRWPTTTFFLGCATGSLVFVPLATMPQVPHDTIGWLVAGALSVVIAIQWFVLVGRRKALPVLAAFGQEVPASLPPPVVYDTLPPHPGGPQAQANTTREPPTTERRPTSPTDEAFSAQMVVLRYPAPIAIAYRRFCARTQPRDRLAQLFDTFEITLKYLVYLGLSDLFHTRLRGNESCPPLPKRQGFDLTRRSLRMTLGQWVRSLVDVADELARCDNHFVHELPGVCGSKGSLYGEIFSWLTEKRNETIHRRGGISLESEECSSLLRSARAKLDKFLQEIVFLRNYPLGFVTAGYPGVGERQRYRVHSCMGARVAFGDEVYPMETKVKLPVNVPFIVHPDETSALCLWPFLLHRESDTTQRPSLYVFEEIDPDCSHLTRIKAAAIDHDDEWVHTLHPHDADTHDWLWDRLRQLPHLVAIDPLLRLKEGLSESLIGRLTGESLGDDKQYKLIGPIARGGFGTVYDAVDTRTHKRVAVKVLEDHEGLEARSDHAQLKRFQQEYEKLLRAGQKFPGIIPCFEFGIDILGRREYPWFSMEFAAGGDLNARLLERRVGLGETIVWEKPALREAAIAEFQAIVEAVAHLHDLNIIHRDIKPANVLILDGGELRLSDFGLVKEADRPRTGRSIGPGSSSRGSVVGTRDYMAPEQERGDRVALAADVYSLGIVLAELATGHRPEAKDGVTAGSPIDHDRHLDRLPGTLRELIVRCTDIDPRERPEDARSVQNRFQRVMDKVLG